MKLLHSKYFLTFCILCALFMGLMAGAKAAPSRQTILAPLFRDAGLQGVRAANSNPAVIRSRLVELNFALLDGDASNPTTDRGSSLILNLFDNVTYTAVLDHRQLLANGGYGWSGHLEGIELSQVVFAVFNGVTSASITLPGANYQIRPDSGGVHVIQEINDAALPPDLHKALPIEGANTTEPIRNAATQPDDGSVIDIMVLYTQEALTAAGSTDAMAAIVNQSVIQANSAFVNSRVNTQLRLVYSGEVDYKESGFEADLMNLSDTTDEFLNEVHTLRDQYSADLVSLFVAERASCGIAYVGGNAFYGFSVINYDCAPNLVLAHELGHNLGALHDWYVMDQRGWAPDGLSDNHGWVDYDNNWRTIMSYAGYCYEHLPAKNCSRIAYFSNPELAYIGQPIGLRAGSDDSCKAHDTSRPPTCDANNARVFNANLKKIANYRASQLAVITPTPTNSPTPQPTFTPTPTPSPTLAGTPSIRINFQPAAQAILAGNLADSGSVYANRGNGYIYGWNTNNSGNTRSRTDAHSPDPRHDTLIYMQRGSLYTWEIALPNGAYQVHAVAGDPNYYSSVFKIEAEGTLLVDGTPNATNHWVTGISTVHINDGRLTITNASGAVNNKLCFIEITPLPNGPVQTHEVVSATNSSLFSVTFAPVGLQLDWSPDQPQNVANVQIFRSEYGNRLDAIELSDSMRNSNSSFADFNAIDYNASVNGTYYYWVAVTDKQGAVRELGPVMEGAEDRLFHMFLPTVSN